MPKMWHKLGRDLCNYVRGVIHYRQWVTGDFFGKALGNPAVLSRGVEEVHDRRYVTTHMFQKCFKNF